MKAPELEMNRWIDDLTRFTERNNARTIDIEVFTEEFGAQPEVRQLKLNGAAFDRHDRRVDIMVGGADDAHLTHSIGHVRSVEILVAPRGVGDILNIEHKGGRTIVRPSLQPAVALQGNSCLIDL
jgi:hypothetical protein